MINDSVVTLIPVCELISQIPEPGDQFPSAELADHWRQRGCGIACIRMVLKSFGVQPDPYWPLIQEGLEADSYCDRGWVHQGLVDMAQRRGILGQAKRNATAQDVAVEIAQGALAIASVTVCFRGGQHNPSDDGRCYRSGGHLVLVTGVTTDHTGEPARFRVHHPSATEHNNWANRWVNVTAFTASFSGSYMAFGPASATSTDHTSEGRSRSTDYQHQDRRLADHLGRTRRIG